MAEKKNKPEEETFKSNTKINTEEGITREFCSQKAVQWQHNLYHNKLVGQEVEIIKVTCKSWENGY